MFVCFTARTNSFVGTAEYVPPEILTYPKQLEPGEDGPDVHVTTDADLWSLGCIVYQMLTGKYPFRGRSEMLTFERIKKCDLYIPDNMPEDAASLIRGLLRVNPCERLGANRDFAALKAHPFFKGIVFDKLWEQTPPEMKPFPYKLNFPDEDSSEGPKASGASASVSPSPPSPRGGSGGEGAGAGGAGGGAAGEGEGDEEAQRANKIKADTEKWRDFIRPGEQVIECGLVRSKKLRGRDAILLLTDTPRLVYVNPKKNVVKKEKAWTLSLCYGMLKAPDTFFLKVNKKTHKYKDCDGNATRWLNAFDEAAKIHKSSAVPQEDQ